MTQQTFGALDVLRYARRMIEDGGDTDPCDLGAYCLRCNIANAKTDLDKIHKTGLSLYEMLGRGFGGIASDAPLVEARNLVSARDDGIVHTKESALEMLDQIIAELEGE